MSLNVIILAAGKGTRMKSDVVKVAHKIGGKPILQYVIDTVRCLDVKQIYVVVGHQSSRIKDLFEAPDVTFVTQDEQLGTGHAVMQVEPYFSFKKDDDVVVLAGDCPLIRHDTLQELYSRHKKKKASGSILTVAMEDPAQYGRILRNDKQEVLGIREARDCDADQLAITEINTGVYLFNGISLFDHLKNINTDNAQKELYLTDVLHLQKEAGETITAYCDPDADQATGVNTRHDLATIHKALYRRAAKTFMDKGVTIVDPDTTFIDPTVSIGYDTVIEPFTIIRGNTVIGSHCHIGSHCFLNNVTLDDHSTLSPQNKLVG